MVRCSIATYAVWYMVSQAIQRWPIEGQGYGAAKGVLPAYLMSLSPLANFVIALQLPASPTKGFDTDRRGLALGRLATGLLLIQ